MALNFPPSDASPWTAPNGVVYTWNTDGYWEAKADPADLDGEYLKLDASNDPVTGTCEFAGGVKVTGGADLTTSPGMYAGSNNGGTYVSIKGKTGNSGAEAVRLDLNNPERSGQGGGAKFTQTKSLVGGQEAVLTVSGIWDGTKFGNAGDPLSPSTLASRSNLTDTAVRIAGVTSIATVNSTSKFAAFSVQSPAQAADEFIGYYSNVGSADANTAFNFYAAGDAPNYFKGATMFGSGGPGGSTNVAEIRSNGKIFATNGIISCQDISKPPIFDNTGGLGINLSASASFVQQFHQTDTASSAFYLNRTGSTTGKLIQFNYATAAGVTSTQAGLIRLASANSIQIIETSDYRLKENIVDLPNATDRLKAIKPYQYTFKNEPGVIHEGFVAHELQEHSVLTVTGTKDETESIGSLADYDGTVLETEVTEPSAEELTYTEEVEATPYIAAVAATYDEYGTELTAEVPEAEATYTTVTRTRTWTPSGTRPVYQGVDQTKLIPLLTKALQEALDRIEQLESNTLQPLYASLADLPSAADHHGKVAHVHSEGALYFAHAGNWVKLQNA